MGHTVPISRDHVSCTHPINTCTLITRHDICSRSTWPCGLRRPSAAARLLGSRPAEGIDVRHCDRLITSSEAPYRVCLICVTYKPNSCAVAPRKIKKKKYDLCERLGHTATRLRTAHCATEDSGLDSHRKPKYFTSLYFTSLHFSSRTNQTGAGVHQPSHAVCTAHCTRNSHPLVNVCAITQKRITPDAGSVAGFFKINASSHLSRCATDSFPPPTCSVGADIKTNLRETELNRLDLKA